MESLLKNKKILILGGLIIVAILLAASGVHIHVYEPATCLSPSYCKTCNKTKGERLGHDFTPATYENPETCERCGLTRGKKLTPVREWGFENLEEMGNKLVEIYGYNLSDESGPCVYVTNGSDVRTFEDGYMLIENIRLRDGKASVEDASHARSYSVIDNDNLRYGSFRCEIDERNTARAYENFVVFDCINRTGLTSRAWYIPYALIDWDRELEAFDGSDFGHKNAYKLFLDESKIL